MGAVFYTGQSGQMNGGVYFSNMLVVTSVIKGGVLVSISFSSSFP